MIDLCERLVEASEEIYFLEGSEEGPLPKKLKGLTEFLIYREGIRRGGWGEEEEEEEEAGEAFTKRDGRREQTPGLV